MGYETKPTASLLLYGHGFESTEPPNLADLSAFLFATAEVVHIHHCNCNGLPQGLMIKRLK